MKIDLHINDIVDYKKLAQAIIDIVEKTNLPVVGGIVIFDDGER